MSFFTTNKPQFLSRNGSILLQFVMLMSLIALALSSSQSLDRTTTLSWTTSTSPNNAMNHHHRHRLLPGGGRDQDRGDPRGRGQDQQGSSQNSHHHSSASSAHVYGDVHRKYPKHYYTSLVDVLFCLVMALGWTVWLLSSFIKTDLSDKYQNESVVVRGHVLQVSVEQDDSLHGTGIPTYKAIIDYMVPPATQAATNNINHNNNLSDNERQRYFVSALAGLGGANGSFRDKVSDNHHNDIRDNMDIDDDYFEGQKIQIRKEFETSQLLTEGFANVELLVLPNEPTYSVLKDEWEKEHASYFHQQHRSLLSTPANHNQQQHPTAAVSGGWWSANNTTIGYGDGSILSVNDHDFLLDDDEWWKAQWFRRLTIAGAASLVLASVAGGIQVVIRLQPSQQGWGWALVVLGVPLLLPLAIAIQYAWQSVQKTLELKGTFIIRGAERLSSRPCVPIMSCGGGGGGKNNGFFDTAKGCGGGNDGDYDTDDVLHVLSSPAACAHASRVMSSAAGGGGSGIDGCYFVRVKKDKDKRKSVRRNGGNSTSTTPATTSSTPTSNCRSRLWVGTTTRVEVETNVPSASAPLGRDSSTGSAGDPSTVSSVTTVSSVSMQETT